jgi:ABC-type transport system involved in multi-copper enzyme maturation permease subunit
MNITTIALNTFREAVRNKILYSVLLFAALLVGISALFGSVTLGDQIRVVKDFGLFSISFFGAILTIVSGVSLLSKELKQKTVYNILSKPVHRAEFIVGKYLGLTLTVAVLVTIMGAGLLLFAGYMEGKADWRLCQALFFTYLELAVVAAVTIFFSSLVVTPTLTGLFTMATYLAGRSISYLSYFIEEGTSHSPQIAGIVKVFDLVLPDLTRLSVADTITQGLPIDPYHTGAALLYTLAYSTTLLLLAAVIFSKRELV